MKKKVNSNMDMYQKRKMRQEKAKTENKEENRKSNINW